MPCGAEMRSRPVGRLACSCSSAWVSSTISITGLLRSSSSAPASVRLTERVERLSRRTPKRVSSSATYLLTVALDMSSLLAAREKLPCAATSRKVLMRSRLSMSAAYCAAPSRFQPTRSTALSGSVRQMIHSPLAT